jgi:hypothetical protein
VAETTDVVKINFDGAVNVNYTLAANGAVAQEGVVFHGATGRTYRGLSHPLTMESLAFRDIGFQQSFLKLTLKIWFNFSKIELMIIP